MENSDDESELKPKLSYEHLLESLGGFGRYQTVNFIALTSGIAFYTCNLAFMIFAGSMPDNVQSYCNNSAINASYSFFSAVKEWNLPCTPQLIALGGTLQMAGSFLGSLICGPVSDKWGRRSTLILSMCLTGVFCGANALATNFIMFLICRALVGITIQICQSVHYVYWVECSCQKWRFLNYFPGYPFGYLMLSLLAYFSYNWRVLQWLTLIPMLVSLVILLFYSQESALWYTDMGKQRQAKNVLCFMGKQNKSPIVAEEIEDFIKPRRLNTKPAKLYTHLSLFQNFKMAISISTLSYLFFVSSVVFYGLLFGVATFSGNVILNLVIPMSVRLTFVGVLVLAEQRIANLPRRRVLTIGFGAAFLATTTAMILKIYEGSSPAWAEKLCSVCGIVSNALIWPALDTLTTEVLPTQLRTIGFSFGYCWSMIGGVIAPQLSYLKYVWLPCPYIVSSILLITAFPAIWKLIPETKGKELPTMQSL